MEYTDPHDRFCDELDELVERWANKPEDDQLRISQMVGALQFKCFNMMLKLRYVIDQDE